MFEKTFNRWAPGYSQAPFGVRKIKLAWSAIGRILERHFWDGFDHLFYHPSPWLQRNTPAILGPRYCWPHTLLGDKPLSSDLPPLDPLMPYPARVAMGWICKFLSFFSCYYSSWFNLGNLFVVDALPFGLVLKHNSRTSLEEVRAMKAMRAAGLPVPKVIAYGESSSRSAPASILMTRVPGRELSSVYGHLSEAERETIIDELKVMLDLMRSWKSPWGKRVCSLSGGSIGSARVQGRQIHPCESEKELHDSILSCAQRYLCKSDEEFQETLVAARKIYDKEHDIKFSHGDFAFHNVMVHNGHVSGFIDWEAAGWYPEYWEFTTPLRTWWVQLQSGAIHRRLGGDRYEEELEAESAIFKLTVEAWLYG